MAVDLLLPVLLLLQGLAEVVQAAAALMLAMAARFPLLKVTSFLYLRSDF